MTVPLPATMVPVTFVVLHPPPVQTEMGSAWAVEAAPIATIVNNTAMSANLELIIRVSLAKLTVHGKNPARRRSPGRGRRERAEQVQALNGSQPVILDEYRGATCILARAPALQNLGQRPPEWLCQRFTWPLQQIVAGLGEENARLCLGFRLPF